MYPAWLDEVPPLDDPLLPLPATAVVMTSDPTTVDDAAQATVHEV